VNSRFNEVDILSEMRRHTVFVAGKMIIPSFDVRINVVIGPKERLCLFYGSIELDPILTLGQIDPLIIYTTVYKPVSDRSDCILGGRKRLGNLLLSAYVNWDN
jgi:hypothetical protein